MIWSLIEKLADRLIQLLKERQNRQKTLFSEYAKPAFEDFLKVHECYLACFRTYEHMLTSAQDGLGAILERIENDLRFSASQRQKLRMMCTCDFDRLGAFSRNIYLYLTMPYDDEETSQRWMVGAALTLREIEMCWQFCHEQDEEFDKAAEIWLAERREALACEYSRELRGRTIVPVKGREGEYNPDQYLHAHRAKLLLVGSNGDVFLASKHVLRSIVDQMIALHNEITEQFLALREELLQT